MTVLSAVQAAAPALALDPIPSQLFPSSARDMVEMKAVVADVARQIAEEAEWSVLQKIHTITGNGSTESFALPSDFDRMVKDARLWSSRVTTSPLSHILSTDDWLGMQVQDFDVLYGAWIVYGGQLHIKPARENGETVKFFYVSSQIVRAADTTLKSEFSADTDAFILSERLLTLGIVWNWKYRKGTDYAEELSLYREALSREIGRDRGPAMIKVGRKRVPFAGQFAYPYELG
jgi:hypothetical protein